VLAGLAHPWSAAAEQPTLERVLLSTGGVGYFGYRAAAEEDGRVRLTVPLRQVDDILNPDFPDEPSFWRRNERILLQISVR
jgi:hypothetical protein